MSRPRSAARRAAPRAWAATGRGRHAREAARRAPRKIGRRSRRRTGRRSYQRQPRASAPAHLHYLLGQAGRRRPLLACGTSRSRRRQPHDPTPSPGERLALLVLRRATSTLPATCGPWRGHDRARRPRRRGNEGDACLAFRGKSVPGLLVRRRVRDLRSGTTADLRRISRSICGRSRPSARDAEAITNPHPARRSAFRLARAWTGAPVGPLPAHRRLFDESRARLALGPGVGGLARASGAARLRALRPRSEAALELLDREPRFARRRRGVTPSRCSRAPPLLRLPGHVVQLVRTTRMYVALRDRRRRLDGDVLQSPQPAVGEAGLCQAVETQCAELDARERSTGPSPVTRSASSRASQDRCESSFSRKQARCILKAAVR